MWIATYEKTFKNVSKEAVWSAWANVNSWTKWDKELDEVKMDGDFAVGTKFLLRPKGGPKVSITITEVKPMKIFTDSTSFPMARMIDYHELEETPDGLKIKSRIWTEGVLGWLWRKIVAEKVASGVPAQMESLVEYAKQIGN
jgi:hypothetical protein